MLFLDTRYEVAIGSHLLAEFGLCTGVRASLGHVSVRVPEDPTKFIVKGRGYRYDVIGKIDVPGSMGHHDEAFQELGRGASKWCRSDHCRALRPRGGRRRPESRHGTAIRIAPR